MILILYILNLYSVIPTQFFNEEILMTFTGDPRFIHDESAFGLGMLYSHEDDLLYVSAINSLKSNYEKVEVGGVFRCKLVDTWLCSKYFFIPNGLEEKYNKPRIEIRPLFGISFKEDFNKTMLVVCGSNIPFSQHISYFCYRYYRTQGNLISDIGLVSRRTVNNRF
ncbi:hypothetical protein MXB_2766 [Myxobolus squamalis]|nr:hypothetical protein MXB_2766 [Myxobolus squamalis]